MDRAFKHFPTFLLFSFFCVTAFAKEKRVANYYTGTPAEDSFEQFSFWSESGQRAGITYTYGKNEKQTTITYLGLDPHASNTGFQVGFKNGLTLFISIQGKDLKVTGGKGKYSKFFHWKYEGPVDGVGTFCNVCADEEESLKIVKTYFLK